MDALLAGRVGPWTVSQAASFHERAGSRVVERNGTFWVSSAKGFWRPVDFLRPLERQEPPSVLATGYHHVARTGEETGYLPKLLIEDVAAFEASRWSRKLRRDLRKCGQVARVHPTDDPTLVLAQGYEVWQEASRRSGQLIPRGRGEFERLIRARWHEGPQIAVIGVQGNTLGGFLLAHVIGTRCYFDQVVLSSAAAKWPLGVGLYERAMREARQRGAQVVDLGFWDPALPNLDRFKARVGATLVPTPAYGRLLPGLAPWLKRRNPVKYARLMGTPAAGAPEVVAHALG